MIFAAVAVVAQAAPAPTASPLKTIVRVRSSPLCTTLTTTVLYTIQGLQFNDNIIASSRPLLVRMGKELVPDSMAGEKFDQLQVQFGAAPGGVHETNPALVMDNQHMYQMTAEIVHNIGIIDGMLNDPKRFPQNGTSDEDKKALALKAELQAVVDQQRKNLNLFSGLSQTFDLQDLIAKGDGTQGTVNADGRNGQVNHNDQDVSFQDVVSGTDRARIGNPKNPTVDTDPSVSQKELGALANNPMLRFYVGVLQNQQSTGQAESALAQDVVQTVNQCKE